MKPIPSHTQSRHDGELIGLLNRRVSSMVGALPASRMTVLKIKVWLLLLIYTGLYVLALICH